MCHGKLNHHAADKPSSAVYMYLKASLASVCGLAVRLQKGWSRNRMPCFIWTLPVLDLQHTHHTTPQVCYVVVETGELTTKKGRKQRQKTHHDRLSSALRKASLDSNTGWLSPLLQTIVKPMQH
eukprot:1142447-Pelagomonas_calceolata.AAC.2